MERRTGARTQDPVKIRLFPSGETLIGRCGESFLAVLHEHGIPVASECGGAGTCGKCRIRFRDAAPPVTSIEIRHLSADAVAAGWRLACRQVVSGAATIEMGASGAQGDGRPLEYLIGTDAEEASCGEAGDGPHAVAIDLGTTTLSLCLVDLGSGRSLCTIRARNPQRRFGADVISRIGHVRQRGQSGLDALQGAVVDALNRLLERLCETTSIRTTSIRRAVIAGNPTMLHLLLGVSPVGIDVSPFTPAFLEDTHCEAETVGLCLGRGARVETLPAASAYVGADVVAGLLAIDLAGGGERALFVDVGTNGEVVLAIDGRLAACSTAAGPAFEGASIAQGMLAAPGAISSVRIHDGVVVCNVIGGGDARGLCGTGLVAAVAELRRVGGIDASGRFHPDRGERWEGHGKLVRFRLSDGPWPVYLTQQDVREFQLAKAALRAGVECLLERAGVPARDLDAVRVGGAFSSGLQGAQLVETGLLPGIDRERIRAVGNTALQGATCCLLDPELALSARDLANRIGVVELSGDPRFLELYVAGMAFPGVEGGATQ